MSHELHEARIGTLEGHVGNLQAEQARQGEQLRQMSAVGMQTSADVKTLLSREAGRPESLSWGKIGGTAISVLSLLAGMAWLVSAAVEHSPAVMELSKRMDHAEWKYGWAGRIERDH